MGQLFVFIIFSNQMLKIVCHLHKTLNQKRVLKILKNENLLHLFSNLREFIT